MGKPQALGKGLSALIAPNSLAGLTAQQPGEKVLSLAIEKIVPSPLQPRSEFREEQLAELVESIRALGIIQPLIVRKVENSYELIAGERRWRAAQAVGLTEVPAIVRDAGDREVLELALVENLQREDLNAIEEALAYSRLSQEFSMTQEEIAQKVGKNRATVANAMRLLDLAPEVQSYVRQGRLSVGHAKAILSIKPHEEQIPMAEMLIRQGLPVRAAEKLVAKYLSDAGKVGGGGRRTQGDSGRVNSPAIQRVENLLQQHLATRVSLVHKEKAGTISIEYYGADDLDRILKVLGVSIPD